MIAFLDLFDDFLKDDRRGFFRNFLDGRRRGPDDVETRGVNGIVLTDAQCKSS
jgi:hypothetical protein